MGARQKPVGNGNETAEIVWGGHSGPLLDTRGGHQIIDCRRCGFAHAIPLPTEEELAQLYAHSYYAETKPDYLERAAEDEAWAKLGFTDRLDTLEALLLPDQRRLLDIGSGPGYFLKAARERGWHAEGIDPSAQAVAHARAMDIPMTEGPFDDTQSGHLGPYHAITMTNMLEHVPNPSIMIARAVRCLEPGGLLCVTVPNDYNMLQETLRTADGVSPWWVAPPHHLNYFSFASLARLLTSHGLTEVSRLTSFPMELFALMGDQYMGNDALGRACHEKRKRFDLSFARAGRDPARRSFYAALAENGFGREIILFARKG